MPYTQKEARTCEGVQPNQKVQEEMRKRGLGRKSLHGAVFSLDENPNFSVNIL